MQANPQFRNENNTYAKTLPDAYPEFLRAYFQVREAAAFAAGQTGLKKKKARLIEKICEEISRESSLLREDFGAGESRKLSEESDQILLRHASQSGKVEILREDLRFGTVPNDVFKTAQALTAIRKIQAFSSELNLLIKALKEKADSFRRIPRAPSSSIETELPSSWGDVFEATAFALEKNKSRLMEIEKEFLAVPLGLSVLDANSYCPAGFRKAALKKLSSVTGIPFKKGQKLEPGLAESIKFSDERWISLISILNTAADSISRLFNILATHSSRIPYVPSEICLAEKPFSSRDPVKQSLPEFLIQLRSHLEAIGKTATNSYSQGKLMGYDVREPGFSGAWEGLDMLGHGCRLFDEYVRRIEINEEVNVSKILHSNAFLPLLRAVKGEEKALEIFEAMRVQNLSLKEAVLSLGIVDTEEADRILNPEVLTSSKELSCLISRRRRK